MLSEEYILSLIKKYSKTPLGKSEIAKHKKRGFTPRYADGTAAQAQSVKQMNRIGSDMKNILFNNISKFIESFQLDDIIVNSPVLQGNQYMISIEFNEDALQRKSLDPDRYPDGITNIIKLFVNGYDARGAVYGVWEGHGDNEVWSLRHRDPNDFLERAVSEFNSKYANIARAEVAAEYKNNV